MKTLIRNILIATAMMLGLSTLVAPAANADGTTPTPVLNLDINAAGTATLDETTVTTLLTDEEGRVILGPVSNPTNKGALHWLKKDGNKCPLVANQPQTDQALAKIKPTTFVKKGAALKRFHKAVPSAKVVKRLPHGKRKLSVRCYRVKVGGSFTDTGEDAEGQTHGMLNHVSGSPMLFDTFVDTVKESDGTVVTKEVSRRRGQVGAGSSTFNKGDCLNEKADHAEFVPGQYVYLDSTTEFRHHVQGMISQRLHVGGSGRVEKGGCYVEFKYDFTTEGKLAFDQIIKAKTKAEAKGRAAEIVSKFNLSTETEGSIENTLSAQLIVAFGEQCSGNPPPPSYENPTASGHGTACAAPGQQNGALTASGTNPNNVAAGSSSLTVGGKTKQFTSVGAGQTVSADFTGYAPGTYNGSFTLGAPINKSVNFTVTVDACPVPEDNPPTMVCTVPEHIYVGDDAMWADFDLTDPDGDAVSFNEPVLTGPIEKTTTDLTNVPGGKRFSVKFRATAIPAGTSQTATIKVTGQAGGKSVSCSGTVTVENNDTGW
ncbi:MAG TPA: hypothetical protein PL051_01465 [Candidatus Saccharibacteria bacterium]|nr:hypothetical protein [Candidatus Saccharibacteria bacterium]